MKYNNTYAEFPQLLLMQMETVTLGASSESVEGEGVVADTSDATLMWTCVERW